MKHTISAGERMESLLARIHALHCRHLRHHYGEPELTTQQRDHLLSTFGLALPETLLATWMHAPFMSAAYTSGALPGMYSFDAPLGALMQWRVNTAITYELRSGAAQLLQDDATLQPTQAVRHDAWNRGWFPIGMSQQTYRTLYVDMAPGLAGRAGQIIEAPSFQSSRKQYVQANEVRVVATSWLAYLSVAVDAWEAQAVTAANDKTLWRFTANDEDFGVHELMLLYASQASACSINTEVMVSFCATLPSGGDANLPAIDLPALASHHRATWPPLQQPLTHSAEIVRRMARQEHSYRDSTTSDALGCFDRWSRDAMGHPCALLFGAVGSGRTALLRALASGLLEAAARGEGVPVPVMLDLWRYAKTPSPRVAIDAFVHEATGQHNGGAAVLQAVAQGRCLLLFDNAEALLVEGKDPWAWCRGALADEQPDEVARRSGARLLVSCATEALPAPGLLRNAVAALAPGWASAPDLALLLKELSSPEDSASRVQALEGEYRFSVQVDELVEFFSGQYNDSQREERWFNWKHRPAWLKCLRSPSFETELKAVAGYGASWRALIHSWPAWLALRQTAFAGELLAAELAELANSLAQRMWANEATAPQGGDAPYPELHQSDMNDLVQALRPDDPAAQKRALWQVRLNLGLQLSSEDRVRFVWRRLHIAIVARSIVASVCNGDAARFKLLLSRPLLTLDMLAALFCAWGIGPNDALVRMIDDALSSGPSGTLSANLRALEAHWAQELRQLSYRPEAASLPPLVLTSASHRFNAAGMDLAGQNFNDRDLRRACFDGARLDRCSFAGANLEDASFRDALAEGAVFVNAKADGLQAQGLIAPRSCWSGAALGGATFEQANLGGAVLRDLVGAEFNAQGADLSLASLDESFTQRAGTGMGAEIWRVPQEHRLRAVWHWYSSKAWMKAVFSPDGSTFVLSDADSRLSIWHWHSGKQVRQWTAAQGLVLGIAFLPDNRTLVTGHADGTVQRWDARTGASLGGWQVDREAVTALAVSNCGAWLATGDTQGYLRRWHLPLGTPAGESQTVEQPVMRVCFVRGVNTLWASFHGGNMVEVDFDTGVGRAVTALQDCVTPRICSDGEKITVMTQPQNGGVRLLSFDGVESKELLFVRHAKALELSPDGKRLFVMNSDGAFHVRELDTGTKHVVERGDGEPPIIEFAPSGQQMLLAWPKQLHLVDIALARTRPKLHLSTFGNRSSRAYWLPDGRQIAIAVSDVMLDATTGQRSNIYDASRPVAYNRNEPLGRLHGLDVRAQQVLRFEERPVRDDPAATPEGLRVLSSAQFKPKPQDVNVGAFSNNGACIALLLDRGQKVRVWPVPDVNAQAPTEGVDVGAPAHVRCLALSDDGALLALGLTTSGIALMSVESGQVLRAWQAQLGSVAAVVFVAGGRRVLTFGEAGDSVCRLWEVPDGTLVGAWLWPHAAPVGVQVGPDGHLAITADVVAVVDAALFERAADPVSEVENLPVRFTARSTWDGSVLVLHSDGRYSAFGPSSLQLGLFFEEVVSTVDARPMDRWPRTWAPSDVPERASHLDTHAAQSMNKRV